MDRKHGLGNGILFAFCLCFLCSCHTQKKIAEPLSKKMNVKEAFLKAKLSEEDFRGLEMSFSAKISSPMLNQSFSGQMKFIKDTALFISAGKFGLEAFRILITQDSVFLLNRLERSYITADHSFLENYIGKDVGFEDVQSLLLGRVSEFGLKADMVLKDSVLHLVSQKALWRVSAQWDLIGQKLSSYQIESGDAFYLKADYSGNLEAIKACPKDIRLYAEKPMVFSLDINYSKGKIDNSLELRFSIPDKYSKTEL